MPLTTVRITTRRGEIYEFPAVDRAEVLKVLPAGKREEFYDNQPTLVLVNASLAALSIPFRIIKTVELDSPTAWEIAWEAE